MAKVILVCGPICCGKTTYAHRLRQEYKAVVLSMDEVMLALWDPYLGDLHDLCADRTRKWLLHKAEEIVRTGIDVILDWGPWTKAGREEVKMHFISRGIPCELRGIRVDDKEWHRRIEMRNSKADGTAYLVDDGLMQKFLSKYEAFTESEGQIIEG